MDVTLRAQQYCKCIAPFIYDVAVLIMGQPWQRLDEGGRRPDAERPEQKRVLFRGMDSQQCPDCSLLDSTAWLEDVFHLRWQLHVDPRALQARW